jgi:hypothetical protein
MVQEIKIFLFILSLIFTMRFILEFIMKFFQDEPEPINITKYDIVFIYLTISYIITFIII